MLSYSKIPTAFLNLYVNLRILTLQYVQN